ncbi:exopolysaccharide biosynthesis protein [Gilvimarinus algae]|uniref:Exopolysaccharide biosynthesis protein n=1 Tax=Gilvimarinus algae TaxID=3058037 RepID=A0ABT8TL32_9GAMM|nr:exopolysaccharide biosynthesis protein [Gilvimarinus sp. SDUM040014]MDO3383052.1 exopolysaccharide biosynthesis protein [Gilvimarinus sp. SDUM040014]
MEESRRQNLTQTIDLIEQAEQGERLHVGNLIEAFKDRGFGPLLLLPALITFLPTGGIPGVPVVCAILILFFSLQMLWGKSAPWIPRRLARVDVSREKFVSLLESSRPVTKRIDKVVQPRYRFMTGKVGARCIAVLSIALAISLIPLGPIPFAAAIPSGILVLLALALVARDGLLMIIGVLLSTVGAGFLLFG